MSLALLAVCPGAGLFACNAESGAVAKPLVFESSAKRAAVTHAAQREATSGPIAGTTAASSPTPSSSGAAAPGASDIQGSGNRMTAAPGATAGSGSPDANASTPRQPAAAGGEARTLAPVADSAGAQAPAPGTQEGHGATACEMLVTYTAVGMHGMWYPHNIGAVWVEDANGKFIKTIERWAGIRAGYLANWNMREDQHGAWPSCPFPNVCTGPMVPDQMDVVSQATIFEDNAMHMAKWTCKDLNGEVVPDGAYKLFFEEMENIYPAFPEGPLGMVEFEKGAVAATLTPMDQAPFKNLKIAYEPIAP